MKKLIYYVVNIVLGLVFVQFISSGSTLTKLIGLGLIVIHLFIIFHIFHDQFLFIVYLLCQCTMGSSDKIGGITLAPLIIILAYLLFEGKLFIKDKFIGFCLLILCTVNFLGYLLKNPSDMFDLLQGVIIFSGFILTFIFIQNFNFSATFVKSLFHVLTFISIILFIVALNQKYVFIDSSFFLLGTIPGYSSVSRVNVSYDGRFPSLFGDYELFSEFSLLMFILAFSVFMDKKSIDNFALGNTPLYLMLFSFMNTLITGTRSGFILLFAFVFMFFVVRTGTLFTKKTLLLFAILIIMVPVIINFGDLIGFDFLMERINEIDRSRLSMNSLVTGEQLNRSTVYAEGFKRLGEVNWTLGYGYGVSSANNQAWLGKIGSLANEIRDFHSLYLCIPMIYGWIGGVTYIVLILHTIIKIFKNYLRKDNEPVGGIALGFAFIFIFFMVNELKINSLRAYNYHFLIWILLGIAISFSDYRKQVLKED